MKRARTGAIVAALLGCTAMLGAQTNSTTGGATSRSEPKQSTAPAQGPAHGDRETTSQDGSKTRTTSTGSPRRARTSQTAQKEEPQEITLTGCLATDEGAVGTSGASVGRATGTTSTTATTRRSPSSQSETSMPKYTLSGGSVSGASTSGASANNATPSTTGTSGSGSYQLQGSALEGHVGQQVEVRGMVLPPERTRPSRRRASADAAAETAQPQQVRVFSVRMVAANCGGNSSDNRRGQPGGNR